MIGIAAGLFHSAFHVRIEPLGVRHMRAGGDPDFGSLGSELAARFGSAGLDDHGPALHGTSDIERAATRKYFPLWFKHMQFVRSK